MTKRLAPAVFFAAMMAIVPQAAGQGNNTITAPAGDHADRVDFQSADSWLGKWSGASSYSQTDQVWEWWFTVSRPCNDYLIQTHTSGPETIEILSISATELEFLFHDALGTHVTLVRQGNDVYTGTVSQPNNKQLPRGRVDGRRIEEAAAVPASGALCDDAEAPDPYADEVIAWTFGDPGPSEGPSQPRFALGAPDYTGSHLDPGIVTLGCGGQIVVRFSDNVLVDGEGDDLRIFEPGDREAYRVEISPDGADWRRVGRSQGGNASFDIAPVVTGDEQFRFVRLTDERGFCRGVRPGMDIDAVEALNTRAETESLAAGEEPAPASGPGALQMEMTPLEPEPGGGAPRTGEPLDAVITVTNTGADRVYMPSLELRLSGEAVAPNAEFEVEPAKPRQDAEAAFFDITCTVSGATATCPLGYGDQLDAGKTYLEPGEARSIYFRVTLWEAGAVVASARAAGTIDGSETVAAAASRRNAVVGPILGLRLLGTTPEPYGYSDNPRLPLHEGRDITLRYGILNSSNGGHAREVALDFFTRTGEVVSVTRASGEAVPCGRPKPTDRRTADCVIAGLAPGESLEVSANFRYGRRFMVETGVHAGTSAQQHAYETWMDLDPVVVSDVYPPPSSTVAPGTQIGASFTLRNRGRDAVEGAVLHLALHEGEHSAFGIEKIEGCAAFDLAEGRAVCQLPEFSNQEPHRIEVLTTAVPEGATGDEIGLSWELKVPVHSFPFPSTANEKGYLRFGVAERVADLFVAEYLPADDIEPGVPEVFQLEIGNNGTWPQEGAELVLRVDFKDERGGTAPGPQLGRAAALLSDPQRPDGIIERPCALAGNEAVCPLGELRPWESNSIIFEINSGDLAKGTYRYTARISEGLGEAGVQARIKDNVVSGGARVFPTGETVADLLLFRGQGDKTAFADEPQGFDLWVENIGTLAQEGVVLKLEFDVDSAQATQPGLRFLSDVYAVIPSLGDSEQPLRRVPCAVAEGTASCALGRLAPEDLAQVFVEWNPFGLVGQYRYAAQVGDGAGEAASNRLGDNRVNGGGEIVKAGVAAVAVAGPQGTIEYPVTGDEVTRGSSALGTFQELEADHELWYFSFSPVPEWYHLRPVGRDPGASGTWAIHNLSHGRPGSADIGYVYRIGIIAADAAASASLRENAARLKAFPPGTTVLHEIQVTRVGR